MPGTVQVTIFELQGLPTSTPSSSMSIKVSLGKNVHETQGEKGDFLLPLATLRDNLVVKVNDAEGNEIAHTGVKSRSIAEKGFWDDLFPFEGGGHVHMRLKFSLSEEERNKIRDMRESALKKKQQELLTRSSKGMETGVTSSGGKKEIPATAPISNKVHSSNLPPEASSKVTKSSAPTQAKEDTQHQTLIDQTQSEKTPSKVRKKVAAPESSPLLQEQMPDVTLTTEVADARPKKQTSEDISAESVESPLEGPSLDGLQEHKTSSIDERVPVEISSNSYEPKFVENIELITESKGNSHEKVSSKKGEDQLHALEESRKGVSSKESSCSSSLEQCSISGSVLPQEAPIKVIKSSATTQAKEDTQATQAKEDTQHHNPTDQTQSEKTPSKVRKRVAVFKSSPLLQEQMPDVNLTTAKPQPNRKIEDAHPKKQTSEDISTKNVKSPVEDSSLDGLQEHQTSARDGRGPIEICSDPYEPKCVENIVLITESSNEGKDQLHDLEVSRKRVSSKESSCSSSTISGRVLLDSDKSQPSNPVSETRFTSVDSFPSEAQRVHSKRSQERMSLKVAGGEHHSSCQNFRGWIFLEETTCSCVADNRTVIDRLADVKVNKNIYTGKFFSDNVTSSSDKKHSGITKESKLSPSSGSGDSQGPNGQVLKIVMMVGFGLLVLFTRKTKSR